MEGFGSRAVASITGLTQRQIDYWDRTALITPSLASSSGRGTRRLYDFVDLVQFRVAASLREQGISLQKIRKSIHFLRKAQQDLERPLASLKFLTDGATIFVLTTNNKVVLDTLKGGQFVLSLSIGPMLRDLAVRIKEIERKRTHTVQVGKKGWTVVLHADLERGGYWVECPGLPGCMSQGETVDEALSMIRDSIRGHLAVTEKASPGRKAI